MTDAAQPAPGPRSGTDPAPAVRRAAWAVFAVFFLNGFLFAGWASRLPTVRDRLDLSANQMGLLLLFSAIGSICALPLAGAVTERLGTRRTVLVFAGVAALGMLLVALAVAEHGVGVARAGLLVAGVGIGVWDASMNLQGAHVEQRLGRAIMPRFHAGFSFGTVTGAGLGALAAWAHLPVPAHLIAAVVLMLAGVLVCLPSFLAEGSAAERDAVAAARGTQGTTEPSDPADAAAQASQRARSDGVGSDGAGSGGAGSGGARRSGPERASRPASAWTEPRTLLIGLVVLGAALTEGAANDWVSLATVDGFETSAALGAVALAVFLVAMTGMRLLGTALLDRFGRVAVLRACATTALAGIAVFTLVPYLPLALVGVALWGLGAALGFPVGMSAASDEPARAAARVSVVATVGYSAFFIGPPLIGFLAHAAGYRHALLVVAVPVVLGLALMGAVRPLRGAVGHDDEPAGA